MGKINLPARGPRLDERSDSMEKLEGCFAAEDITILTNGIGYSFKGKNHISLFGIQLGIKKNS